MRGVVLGLVCLGTGCYSGWRAAQDVNLAWEGRARTEVTDRIGAPATVDNQPDGTRAFRWRRSNIDVASLPDGHLNVDLTPGHVSIDAAARPGVIVRRNFEVAAAVISPDDRVLRFDSDFVVAGVPSGVNIHTGVIFGFHAGMGAVANATTPIPSGGLYIGGMVSPQHALVGSYSFFNGKGDKGYAMGHVATFGLQYWVQERLALMGGGSMVLGLEPGLTDASLQPGASGALSYAAIRAGSFVLDVRLDATVATKSAFGMLGVGVNVN